MPASTTRLEILDQIKSRLEGIRAGATVSAVNGGTYLRTLRHVGFYEGFVPDLDAEQLPAAIIVPGVTSFRERPNSYTATASWSIAIVVTVARQELEDFRRSPVLTIAEELWRDIERALSEDDGFCSPVGNETSLDFTEWEPVAIEPDWSTWVAGLVVTYTEIMKQF